MAQSDVMPKSIYDIAAMLEELPESYQLLAKGILIGLDTARNTSLTNMEASQEIPNCMAG